MAWNPISKLPIQYYNPNTNTPYSGAVLKAYAAGTTTNINFATDSTGNTQISSVALNAHGYAESGGTVIIPHMSQDFKLALYPNQAAADSDTGAVIPAIDNIRTSPLLEVIATGTTIGRTLEDRFADLRSVKDFGAKGDGATDDTTAIQAAIDTFNTVFFPEGVYMHSGITVNDKTVLKGAGRGLTELKLISGSNTDSLISTGAYDFIDGTRTDYQNAPADIIIEDLTINGNWADWTFPRSTTDQPVYNTGGNGIVIYSQRCTIDVGIINVPEMFLYYHRADTEAIAQGLNRRARGRINIDCTYCGKQGGAIIDSDIFVENIQMTGVAVLMNGVNATSSSLITDADGDVAGLILDGGEYGQIHVSGPHQGASGDDSPAVKVVGGTNRIINLTTENSRSGLYLKSGQTKVDCILRDLKDTTTNSYLLKVDSDFNDISAKARRFTSNGTNADSDIKSVIINGDSNDLDLTWFNANNPETGSLFNGDAVSVSGDFNKIECNLNAPKGSGVILETGAYQNKIDIICQDGGDVLEKLSSAANYIEITAAGCSNGIKATVNAPFEKITGFIGAAPSGTYYTGNPPTIGNGQSWSLVGLDSSAVVSETTRLKGSDSATIASGTATILKTINLAKTMMWIPALSQVRITVSTASTEIVSATAISVSKTQLVVRLSTAQNVTSDTNYTILYDIDMQ